MSRNNFAVFLSDEQVAGYGRICLHVILVNSSELGFLISCGMWAVTEKIMDSLQGNEGWRQRRVGTCHLFN